MYDLKTGKRVSGVCVIDAETSGMAIEDFKNHMRSIGVSTEGHMIMAEDHYGE
jgi:hypothetical protein